MADASPRQLFSRTVFKRVLALGLLLIWTSAAGAAPAYDAARVAAHVRMLAETIGARAAGTAGEQRAAAYLARQLKSYGLDVAVQDFEVIGGAGSYTSANVVATKPGRDARYGTLFIGAHYDSVPGSPGANDNASGTAVLLELGRLLADETLKPEVVLIAFGAEEVGLRGSGAFVRQLSPLQRLMALGMFNLDCIGYGDRHIIATSQNSPRTLVEQTAAEAVKLGMEPEVYFNRGSSDHVPFASAGIPAAFLATQDATRVCGPFYHQPTDTVDTLHVQQMELVAEVVLATTKAVAARAPLKHPTTLRLPIVARAAP